MPQKKKRKRRTPRQELGIKLALKLGLPIVCPLYIVDDDSLCKETGEYCGRPELDAENRVDYRLCETFSAWFWREVKKEELEGLAPPTPPKQSPEQHQRRSREAEDVK